MVLILRPRTEREREREGEIMMKKMIKIIEEKMKSNEEQ